MIKVIAIALPLIASSLPAFATDFTDQTPCSVVVRAADRQDQLDLRRAGAYVVAALKKLDADHAARGGQALSGILTHEEFITMIRDTAALCRSEPTSTVFRAAASVYLVTQDAGQ